MVQSGHERPLSADWSWIPESDLCASGVRARMGLSGVSELIEGAEKCCTSAEPAAFAKGSVIVELAGWFRTAVGCY